MSLPTLIADLGPGWEGARVTSYQGKLIVAHPSHRPLVIDIAARTFVELTPFAPKETSP